MVTRKAKFLSKDESKGFHTNAIYDIDTQVDGQKIIVVSNNDSRQARLEYHSKLEFLKDWLVID
ncbi:hypothetical protein GXP67_31850 [Rhodocytophaga rosea]|uniref:Uncharacterized protein n=1 Tax=Rhodocytophaga rosea TaxID=2704465 RepID=A0A6C0GS77_9BACT|nr:hypothetical protein [Rhodocytophaga rosea]QHT70916.1 hypothetical protein GXP67_31850 [Rhodocytophaga rosea]